MAHDQDLIAVLTADHRTVERLFAEIETSTGDPKRRREVIDVVIAELSRHASVEEQYLYPAAREYLSAGEDLADHEITEHAEAEELMRKIVPLDTTDPQFDTLLAELIEGIRHHVQEQETELFPRLRHACTHETLVDLGRSVADARKRAPTMPHPAAPDRPPLNKLTAPMLATMDRVTDAIAGRRTSPDDL
jgi:hemerythrin-like domain-containing protein